MSAAEIQSLHVQLAQLNTKIETDEKSLNQVKYFGQLFRQKTFLAKKKCKQIIFVIIIFNKAPIFTYFN